MTEDELVGEWLTALASEEPAPGGGAAAAVNLGVGAALVSMVCNLTIGKPRYAEHEATMTAALSRAEELRAEALRLADEDTTAFGAVSAAYRLPREDPIRAATIQAALQQAAAVPMATAERAVEVIELAGGILAGANVNLVSDVAVAASSARAALQAARVNVEVNLAAIEDEAVRASLAAQLDALDIDAAEARADAIVAAVRARILP